jgi:hypothetical protein
MKEMINLYKILVGKSQGKRTLVKFIRSWDANIKLALGESVARGWS